MSASTSTSVVAATPATVTTGGTSAPSAASQEDDYNCSDQVKVYSHEGDGENTEHLNSMDLHDIKTELVERDAEKAETPKAVANATSSPTFISEGSSTNSTSTSALPQASIQPVIHHPTAMVYANGGAVPFMLPPFAATTPGNSPLYPVMRPVKVETSDWKLSQSNTGQLSIPTYSYPGFLPVDQNGLRPAYPFMAIPGQYVTTQVPYQTQFTALGQSVAPNATVQPNTGGMLTAQVKEKKPHIKKPLNAFMLFMKQKRADVIKECTLKESAAINQILGKMWHALDRNEQAKYYEMAREERAKHMQMYPGWSARDNYAIHKKRRKRKVKQVDTKPEEAEERIKSNQEEVDPTALVNTPTATLAANTSPIKTVPSALVQRPEEEDSDLNNRKCRARFGLDQQHMWCSPCRRKKKCIRYSVDDEEHGAELELEEDAGSGGGVAGSAEGSVLLSESADPEHHKELPRLLRHDVPITLQTIPT